ncbi:MAG: NAD(P)H-hydrate dehydratase [Paraglaciecola sp.]|uniref:NAD(P)H-hydrate dehydratase n=1 Tax=Paraglaciecola sp. TaxID=1920173 RepID=UPI003299F672
MTNLLTEQAAQILAHKIVSSEQVKLLESKAAQMAGCSMFELMQRAGDTAFQKLIQYWPNAQNIIVVAGNGNNAGDGYVLAKLALNNGMRAIVVCQDPNKALQGVAKQAQSQWNDAGGLTLKFTEQDFSKFDVIVDALLGTGVQGEVKPNFQTVIQKMNLSKQPVLSIDLPSGMNANTGEALPISVIADVTVSFIAVKPGLVTGVGKETCGKLSFADLRIASEFFGIAQSTAQLVDWKALQPIKPRTENANKGSFGKLLCIGGNQGMGGAIRLSAEAALRCGTGLVKVYCHSASCLAIASGRPEIMIVDKDLETALQWCSGIIIGPGLGQDPWAQQQFNDVMTYLKKQPKPLVIDADGLNVLATKSDTKALLDTFTQLPALILTPHPGEASRLLGCNIPQIENNRYLASKTISQKFNAICVLKGAGTIIQSNSPNPKDRCWVCTGGNPGMATAGMGDLLTGVIGSFLAQGMYSDQAAVYAVSAHAEAADRIALQFGQRGMIATDLFQPLRAIVNGL